MRQMKKVYFRMLFEVFENSLHGFGLFFLNLKPKPSVIEIYLKI